jgi:eukaryotic-like serine/threonine-protein kinase
MDRLEGRLIVPLSQSSQAYDETLDAPLPITRKSQGSSGSPAPAVALIAGSSPHMSAETQTLLAVRLRLASLILFGAFFSFFIKNLFDLASFKTTLHMAIFWSHLSVTVLTGFFAFVLCRKCPKSLKKLRVAELLIFGSPALFFLLMHYAELTEAAAQFYVAQIGAPWMLLIFTYAMFIPNTWRRAAIVIGVLAALPVLLELYLAATDVVFAGALKQMEFRGSLLGLAMVMTVAAVSATLGVQTIGLLRREAFKARQLGQYHLKHSLGSGGMGEVYLAEHQLMKRPVAIKVIRPEKAGDPQVIARFEREVRSTAKLSHWNTVEIFDYGRADDGTFYYVMEYLPGLSLAQLVSEYGPLPSDRMIHLMTQTCEALAEAHSHGLVHRDLKPGNIFAAHRGGVYDVAKLLDFGLVKPMADAQDSGLTQEGTITGSPLYMSPEQATGDGTPDGRSDIYSLGAVMYLLLTGRPPFDSDKAIKVMIAHAHEPVVPPSEFNAEIPEDLEQVVLRCLAKDPQDRYQDAASLRQALLDCDGAGRWTREHAAEWWECNGCPKKKALDAAAMAGSVA